jgi:polyhydroxyalkanoate synthesis regulator phasin
MENLKKLFLAGVGALSLSKERAQRVAKELIAQGKIREQEGRTLVAEMLKKAESARQEVEKTVKTQVSHAYQKVNLATQEQLKKMEKRIQELERELAKKNPSQGRSAKKKRS